MALTQEEIRIRAGLDYSKVTAGLTDIRKQVYKLASDVPKQLGNIFKTTVFGAASELLSGLKPVSDKVLHVLFGIGSETERLLKEQADSTEEFAKKQEQTIKSLKESREKFKKAARDDDFEQGSNFDKQAILETEISSNDKLISQLRERIALLKSTGNASADEQIKLNEALVESIRLQKELRDVRKNFTVGERQQDRDNRYKQRLVQNRGLKQEYRNITEEMQALADDGDFGPNYKRLETQRNKVASQINENTFSNRRDVVQSLPDLAVFEPLKKFFGDNDTFGSRAFEAKKMQEVKFEEALNKATVKVFISGIGI
ncbi:MAG: hypothetical protein QM813_26405 [Verrucomicrobiota bacterium]